MQLASRWTWVGGVVVAVLVSGGLAVHRAWQAGLLSDLQLPFSPLESPSTDGVGVRSPLRFSSFAPRQATSHGVQPAFVSSGRVIDVDGSPARSVGVQPVWRVIGHVLPGYTCVDAPVS